MTSPDYREAPGPIFMLLWYVLLQYLVSASLIFAELQPDSSKSTSVGFSDNEVEIGRIRVTLKQDILKIEGADFLQYLLCFREGQLIFPSNRQELSGEFKGRDGDILVWARIDRQPAAFGDLMFPDEGPPMRLDQLDFSAAYHFKLSQDPSTPKAKIINCLVAKRPIISFFAEIFGIVGGVLLITFIVVFLIWFFTPAPPVPTPECMMPNMRQYYFLSMDHRGGWPLWYDFNFEVPRDCSDRIFNWTRYADRVYECLAHYYPHTNLSDWYLPEGLFGMTPWFKSTNSTPRNNCSLPETSSI